MVKKNNWWYYDIADLRYYRKLEEALLQGAFLYEFNPDELRLM